MGQLEWFAVWGMNLATGVYSFHDWMLTPRRTALMTQLAYSMAPGEAFKLTELTGQPLQGGHITPYPLPGEV